MSVKGGQCVILCQNCISSWHARAWKRFPYYWPFVEGIPSQRSRWCGAMMFFLLLARTSCWTNIQIAGDRDKTPWRPCDETACYTIIIFGPRLIIEKHSMMPGMVIINILFCFQVTLATADASSPPCSPGYYAVSPHEWSTRVAAAVRGSLDLTRHLRWRTTMPVICSQCFKKGCTSFISAFLAATKQLYKWYFPSVCLSVRLSVRPSVRLSHLFHHVPIIVSLRNFQELLPWSKVMSMQKVKVRGQRSRSQRSTPN